jgi:hypothetical protein
MHACRIFEIRLTSASLPCHAAPAERTASVEREPLSLPATAPRPKSNPFGSAKPIDTAAKLKELEARDAQRKVRRSIG